MKEVYYSPLIFKIQSKRRQKDINFRWLFLVFLGFWVVFLGFWAQKPKNTRKSPRKLMSFRFLFGLNFEDEGAIGNFSSLSWKFWLTFNFRLLVSNLQCHMRSYELHYFLLLDPPCFLVALVSDTLLPASAEGEAQAVLLAALLLLDIFIQKCKKNIAKSPYYSDFMHFEAKSCASRLCWALVTWKTNGKFN